MEVLFESLASGFLGALPPGSGPGSRASWAALASLEEALGSIWRASCAAWPGVSLEAALFVRHLAGRWPGDEAADPDFAALRSAELYLCCACLHDRPGAIQGFDRAFLCRVPAALSSLRPAPDLVDEVQQALRHKLFTSRTPGAQPKIADFAGRGPLSLWLRAAALRTALNLLQSAGRERLAPSLSEDALLAQAVAGCGPLSRVDPELAFIKSRDRQVVKAAFRAALTQLLPDQRTLLRLHYLDGLSLAELGALHGTHKTTIMRRLVRAEEAIAVEMRRSLGVDLRLPPAEVDSLIELVISQLGHSLATLIRDASDLTYAS